MVLAKLAPDVLIRHQPIWVSLRFCAANMVEAVIGASILLLLCGHTPRLKSNWVILIFVVGAAFAASVAGGLIAGGVAYFAFGI